VPSFLDTTTFIVAAYLVAALAGAWAAVSALRQGRRLEAASWAGIVLLLVGIALLRELDLLHYVGREVRATAAEEGWYDNRRPYQRLAIRLIIVGGLFGSAVGVLLLKRERAVVIAGFLAMTYVVCLLAVRAVSLHNVDLFMVGRLIGLTRARGMELPGLAIVGAAALLAAMPMPRRASG
jgi:hypothetical protein